MSGGAFVVGAYEHPGRVMPGKVLPDLYQEIVAGVLGDSGLSAADIDGLHSSQTPGGMPELVEVLGLENLRHYDGTDLGGATYVSALGTAARAIRAGDCSLVLVIMGGLPRSGRGNLVSPGPLGTYEAAQGSTLVAQYALLAQRHMHEFGTSREQLAHIKVASSWHASHNPHAYLRDVVTVDEVLEQPPIATPLHRMDCCVTTDGGGALLIANEDIARALGGPKIEVVSFAEAGRGWANGHFDIVTTPAAKTGPEAFRRAGIGAGDIGYASIYDSFTITVLVTLEDLGFCAKGRGGAFVAAGSLLSPHGVLPMNTDGGGLSNNHPDMRGGMVRAVEAVRQLRGTAAPALQVADLEFAVVHGSGFSLGSRAFSSTCVLARRS